MIKPEQVPEEAVKAFKDKDRWSKEDWERKCIAAAINAWPGLTTDHRFVDPKVICLPLEKNDD
jgi:hypothetical protein